MTLLQEFTKLPLKTVNVADKALPDIIVKTPNKGEVVIALKQEHYPFLFGTATQLDRHTDEILADIHKLENEAKEYLLDNWVKTL